MFVFLFVLTWDTATIKININSILSVLNALQVFINLTFPTNSWDGYYLYSCFKMKSHREIMWLAQSPTVSGKIKQSSSRIYAFTHSCSTALIIYKALKCFMQVCCMLYMCIVYVYVVCDYSPYVAMCCSISCSALFVSIIMQSGSEGPRIHSCCIFPLSTVFLCNHCISSA